jgi:hypothetical protein
MATGAGSAAHAVDDGAGSTPSLAVFGNEIIDLRDGWQGAGACTSDGTSTVCFETEAEMDAYLVGGAGMGRADMASEQAVALASCSSSVRLYEDTGYAGDVLQLSLRGSYINLSGYGFSDVTSSYKVGACSAVFYDGTGGGTVYPGSTAAYAAATSMVAGN